MSSGRESNNDWPSLFGRSAETGEVISNDPTLSLDKIVIVQDTMIRTLFGVMDHLEDNMKEMNRNCASWNSKFDTLINEQQAKDRCLKEKVEKALADLSEVSNTLGQASAAPSSSSGQTEAIAAPREMANNQSFAIPQARRLNMGLDQWNMVRASLEHGVVGNGQVEANAVSNSVVLGVGIHRNDADGPVHVGPQEESHQAMISQPVYQASQMMPSRTFQMSTTENNPGLVNQNIAQLADGLLLVDLQCNGSAQNFGVQNGQVEVPSFNVETPWFLNQPANTSDQRVPRPADKNGSEGRLRTARKPQRVFRKETSFEILVKKQPTIKRTNELMPLKKRIKRVGRAVKPPCPPSSNSEDLESRRITRSMVKKTGERTRSCFQQ